MKTLVIIGGGAAGMAAAAFAGELGVRTVLLEKNEKLGKKLYITGKGRCNLTNECDNDTFFKNVVTNPKFLYSSISRFGPYAAMEWFEGCGLKLKTERGNRVFPESDKSSDVIKALENKLRASGTQVRLKTTVDGLIFEDVEEDGKKLSKIKGVRLAGGETVAADYCLIATGGLSYPSTGSTGDGYLFAQDAGHKVTETCPSLVAVNTVEKFVKRLEGLSLKNVTLSAYDGDKRLYRELGEMLFTAAGVSGPLVLTLSALYTKKLCSGKLRLLIDLKPGLEIDKLDERILRDFNESPNKVFANSLGKLLPASLIPVIVEMSGIGKERRVNSVTKEERLRLAGLIKAFPLTSKGLAGYNEAVITKGGVDVKQIDPKTMQSKLVRGLYFAGEVLDVDALTGGFNLQIAWATARSAIKGIEQSMKDERR